MVLKVLNSGSIGNGYILENDSESLVLECGCNLKSLNESIDFKISKVCGCLISHEHLD